MQMASSMASSSSIAEALSLGIPRQGTPPKYKSFRSVGCSNSRYTYYFSWTWTWSLTDRVQHGTQRQRLTPITRARSMSRLSARLDLSIAAAAVVTTYVRKQMRSTSHGHLSPAGDSRGRPLGC